MYAALSSNRLAKGVITPLWVIGLSVLLVFLVWLSAGSTAYAQQEGEGEHQGEPATPDGEPAGPEGEPSGPEHEPPHPEGEPFRPEGEPSGPEAVGSPAKGLECVVNVLGRTPSGPDDFSPEERELVGAKLEWAVLQPQGCPNEDDDDERRDQSLPDHNIPSEELNAARP